MEFLISMSTYLQVQNNQEQICIIPISSIPVQCHHQYNHYYTSKSPHTVTVTTYLPVDRDDNLSISIE